MGGDDLQDRIRKSEIAMSDKEVERKGTWRSEDKEHTNWMTTRAALGESGGVIRDGQGNCK
jgi:hypothetical protein